MKPWILGTLFMALAALSCGSEGGGADVAEDAVTDFAGDAAVDAVIDSADETGADSMTDAVQDVVEPQFPPRKLPFEFKRPSEGEPMTAAEVTAFTKKVTGLWKD
ncbi:MAG: hypothetical protein GXP54_00365, partial [Deltaproteobacteria bacterium]|nr:hypothetical protein [Deltaproteobacteria bacterium]